MGSNSAIVVYADASPIDVLRAYPVLDKPATRGLAELLFPGAHVEQIGDELLVDALNPPEDVVYLGCFPGLELACSWKLIGERPSQATERLLAGPDRKQVYLHAMHSDVDWCSFGLWREGELLRGLSVCRDPGVLEDIGEHLDFERPYWNGQHQATAPDSAGQPPVPFDPMALGEAALRTFVGFVLEGDERLDDVDPEIIPVVGYRVTEDA